MALLVAAALVAWRNVRLGRGDTKAAWRVAGVLFATGVASWALVASHVPTQWEVVLLVMGLSWAGFQAGFAGLLYLAIEPFSQAVLAGRVDLLDADGQRPVSRPIGHVACPRGRLGGAGVRTAQSGERLAMNDLMSAGGIDLASAGGIDLSVSGARFLLGCPSQQPQLVCVRSHRSHSDSGPAAKHGAPHLGGRRALCRAPVVGSETSVSGLDRRQWSDGFQEF